MAEFAPVAPPKLLLDLKRHRALGKYHLLLAHDVVNQPKLYHEVFDDIQDAYIIMDNSLIELGYAVSNDVMAKAIKVVPSSVIVLSDKLNDWEGTVEASILSAEHYHTLDCPFMAVIQGKTLPELRLCIDNLDATIPNIAAWGIPRIICQTIETRWGILEYVSQRENLKNKPRDIHLLGFSDNYDDDILCAKHPAVKGIDSAVPIRLGLKGITLTHFTANNAGPRGYYWQTADAASFFVLKNLEQVRADCTK